MKQFQLIYLAIVFSLFFSCKSDDRHLCPKEVKSVYDAFWTNLSEGKSLQLASKSTSNSIAERDKAASDLDLKLTEINDKNIMEFERLTQQLNLKECRHGDKQINVRKSLNLMKEELNKLRKLK